MSYERSISPPMNPNNPRLMANVQQAVMTKNAFREAYKEALS